MAFGSMENLCASLGHLAFNALLPFASIPGRRFFLGVLWVLWWGFRFFFFLRFASTVSKMVFYGGFAFAQGFLPSF